MQPVDSSNTMPAVPVCTGWLAVVTVGAAGSLPVMPLAVGCPNMPGKSASAVGSHEARVRYAAIPRPPKIRMPLLFAIGVYLLPFVAMYFSEATPPSIPAAIQSQLRPFAVPMTAPESSA